jgi:hypothetical protein
VLGASFFFFSGVSKTIGAISLLFSSHVSITSEFASIITVSSVFSIGPFASCAKTRKEL